MDACFGVLSIIRVHPCLSVAKTILRSYTVFSLLQRSLTDCERGPLLTRSVSEVEPPLSALTLRVCRLRCCRVCISQACGEVRDPSHRATPRLGARRQPTRARHGQAPGSALRPRGALLGPDQLMCGARAQTGRTQKVGFQERTRSTWSSVLSPQAPSVFRVSRLSTTSSGISGRRRPSSLAIRTNG